jgi:peptide deformylase
MNILVYPNKILARPAEPVENIDEHIAKTADAMLKTMYLAKGIGLAANQVGLLHRLVVIDCSHADPAFKPLTLVNPEITDSEGSEDGEEGCLSVPGYFAKVKRPAAVEVKGYDLNGRELLFQADGLLGRCIQHEIDHLDGICFVERLGSLKKTMFRKKWNKIRPGDLLVPEEMGEDE